MMKIYTKTGDDGSTALFGGKRVSKADRRVAATGCVDECNATLGLVRMELARVMMGKGGGEGGGKGERGVFTRIDDVINAVQGLAFELGAVLATPPGGEGKIRLGLCEVQQLEDWIDEFDAGLPQLKSFILPGGSPTAATLHSARAICRRAERVLTALVELEDRDADRLALVILNRLSDLLFVLARSANQAAGVAEVAWQPRSSAENT